MRRKFMSMALTAAMVLSMAATPVFAEDTASDEGFNLNLCIASEPQTIDPALNSAVDGAIMCNHMFEGLAKWVNDGEGNAVTAPGQAESWEKAENEDGTVTYTVKLRDGIKWSDGQAVTAGDFVYAWQRLANPETAADYCYMIDMVKGYDAVADGSADPSTLGITAVDDQTLQIDLTYDCPYFEEIMAFPATFPVRQDMVESSDNWTFDPSTYIGNGPYKMTEWSHNAYISMEKNENYYDYENLGPDTIKFTLLDDNNAMLKGYNNGELDFIENLPVDEIPTYLASGELEIGDYLGTYYVCFNTEDEVFSDPNIRKAFSLVIDRNYIVENVSQAGEVPADGYVPNGVNDAAGAGSDDFRTVGGSYYSISDEDYEANCEEARQLLADAGYPNGEGFPTVEYLYNTADNHKKIGEALQNMWQTELGVTVNLNNQDWNVFLQNRKDGNFQIARNGWIADYNDPCSFLDMWYTDGGNNDVNGELDFIENLPVDEIPTYLASGELEIGDYLGTYYVCFNTEDEVFSDPNIRKAFSLVIDRNYIVENVSQAGEVPADGYVPNGVNDAAGAGSDDFRTVGGSYYSISDEDYEANCEEARQLLADAGYPNGEGFPTVEYLYNTADNHKKIGEALQNMWQTELGVTVNLNNQDWNVFLQNRKDGNFQIARNGWIADYNDPCSFLDMWYTDGGNNDAQYSNPDYDAAIDAAKATSDPEERMKAFHEAEDILIGQDSVLAPIYFYTQPYMLNPDIDGMYYTPLGYFFFGYTSKK